MLASHTVCDAHVPHALWASVGATFMYCVAEHELTAAHTRFTAALGAVVWHVAPSVQVVHAAQAVLRWLGDAW